MDLGLDLAVNARVDDGKALGGWRNTIDFDPLTKHGQWTYVDAFLFPLVDAIKLAATPATKVSAGEGFGDGPWTGAKPGQSVAARHDLKQPCITLLRPNSIPILLRSTWFCKGKWAPQPLCTRNRGLRRVSWCLTD